MNDISRFSPLSTTLPIQPSQQEPQPRQNPQNSADSQANRAQRVRAGQAPLNVLPSNELLEQSIAQAKTSLQQGTHIERGSILNLIL